MVHAGKTDRLFKPVVSSGAASLLSDLAAEQIQALINSGQLKPGSRLPPERELAKMLGVSRTALREALRILEATGAVEASVGRGRFVRSGLASGRGAMKAGYFEANRIEIAELNHVLQLVEPAGVLEIPSHLLPAVAAEARAIYVRASAAVAAGNADAAAQLDCEFHRCLCQRTPNRLLRELIEGLVDSIRESGRAVYAITAAAERSLEQHLEIIAALEAGSRELASDKLRRHAAVAYRFAAEQASNPSR
jgi:GntR family transcriptional repressor for pyruvate dehydrogenase complex